MWILIGSDYFLRHVISAEGVYIDLKKFEAVVTWEQPINTTEVRSFLVADYYRQFVQDFSITATPLTILLRKNIKFVWTKECQRSFEKLKAYLTSTPVLTLPTSDGEFVVYSDTSKKELGCVLIQYGKL